MLCRYKRTPPSLTAAIMGSPCSSRFPHNLTTPAHLLDPLNYCGVNGPAHATPAETRVWAPPLCGPLVSAPRANCEVLSANQARCCQVSPLAATPTPLVLPGGGPSLGKTAPPAAGRHCRARTRGMKLPTGREKVGSGQRGGEFSHRPLSRCRTPVQVHCLVCFYCRQGVRFHSLRRPQGEGPREVLGRRSREGLCCSDPQLERELPL